MRWTPVERSTRLIGLQGRSSRTASCGSVLHWPCSRSRTSGFVWRTPHRGPSAGGACCGANARHWFGSPRSPYRGSSDIRFTTHARQMLAVGRESFHAIVSGWGGLVLVVTAAFLVFSGMPILHMGVPLFATTERIIAVLAAPLTSLEEINAVIVPLLIVFYAGELVWREREARLNEITDAAPVPDWVLLRQVRGTEPGARRSADADDGRGGAHPECVWATMIPDRAVCQNAVWPSAR